MIKAPKDWKEKLCWFEDVPEKERLEYAQKHCSNVYSMDGQSVVIVSFPREDGRVFLYDMDEGRVFLKPLGRCVLGDLFDGSFRPTTVNDFTWGPLAQSVIGWEAYGIGELLYG